MSWTANVLPRPFLNELLIGTHVLGTDTLKCTLYDDSITPSVDDTVYATTGELADATGGYNRGTHANNTLTIASTFPKLVPGTGATATAVVDFDDKSWTSATFSAYGCKIFNSSKSNKLLCELWFNGVKTVSSGTFTIVFPTGDQTTGTIRLASS